MKKISIIIPIYNCSIYLDECINSVVNQTIGCHNLEIIAINDGSTDDSLFKIQEYKKKYPFIKIINQENQGLSVSRNNGIALSNAEYITFLDSDDYLEKDALKTLYKKAKENSSEITVMRLNGFDSKGQYGYYSDKLINKYRTFHIMDNIKFIKSVSVCGKLYKSSFIKNIKFLPKVKHEDIYFTLTAYTKAKKITTIPQYGYYRRYREGEKDSIMQNLSIDTFNDQIINFKAYFSENYQSSKFIPFMIKNLVNYSISHLNSTDKKEALSNIKEIIYFLYEKNNINKIQLYYDIVYFKIYYRLANLYYQVRRK